MCSTAVVPFYASGNSGSGVALNSSADGHYRIRDVERDFTNYDAGCLVPRTIIGCSRSRSNLDRVLRLGRSVSGVLLQMNSLEVSSSNLQPRIGLGWQEPDS